MMNHIPIRIFLFSLMLYGCNTSVWACDPASVQWEQLYKDYDRNHDQQFDTVEWVSLIELKNQSYHWQEPLNPLDPTRNKVFLELDQDHNKLLSQKEMYEIYRFFPDPCVDWNQEQSQSHAKFQFLDWLKDLF